jgi:small conductance mechanosensitive channel
MPLAAAILMSRLLWALIWAIGLLLVLYRLDTGLTPLAAFIGVVGLAASLSLQAVLQNLVAGVYLLAERPFQIGDTIAVVGPNVDHEGRVEDIQMRTTHLRSRDDELILVPNAQVFSGVVTNRTAVGGYVSHVTVTVPKAVQPDDLRARVFPALGKVPSLLNIPHPEVRVESIGSDDWTASILFWVETTRVVSEALWAIGLALPEATVNRAEPA